MNKHRLSALCPSKSGLMNKHIVKHIVSTGPSAQQTFRETLATNIREHIAQVRQAVCLFLMRCFILKAKVSKARDTSRLNLHRTGEVRHGYCGTPSVSWRPALHDMFHDMFVCCGSGDSMKSKLAKLPSSAKLQGIGCKPTGVDAKDGRPHMLGNIGQDEGLEPDKQKEGPERDAKRARKS